MLRALLIRDFVIVEQAEINFENGFTVFSGETGAGKSILIDALTLALGERADTSVFREGANKAEISAVFSVPPELIPWLVEHDLESQDELVLRRVVDAQGRSRAYINGSSVNLSTLKEIGERLVDIHGQHAHQSLLRNDKQRDLLDAHAGNHELKLSLATAWKTWRHAKRELDNANQNVDAHAAAREKLDWQISELNALRLSKGEWEDINSEYSRLAHGQALIDGVAQTLSLLDESDASTQHQLAIASKTIQQLLPHDANLQSVSYALTSAGNEVRQAISELNAYLARVELDPARLEVVESRMGSIFDAGRKFKTPPEAIYDWHQSLLAQRAAMESSQDIESLKKIEQQARLAYQQLADQLTETRVRAAKKLADEVTEAMQNLAMQGGSFQINCSIVPASAYGQDQIDFLVAGHIGAMPKPLSKVASGGELARISLALSVIASKAARVPTLIFDEVDSGIGGAVAEVVGRLLSELGVRHQVLCVTHLPQVAARGQQHYRVSKVQRANTTLSSIDLLSADQRTEEIARMLGGIKITATTRQHAKELLDS
jgi:DNA repair protein RecN (Recombination protein N)